MSRRTVGVIIPGLAVLAVLILVALRAGWFTSSPGGPASGGPLEHDTTTGFVAPISPGQTVTEGLTTLRLLGSDPARITSVRVVGGSPTLDYLGAMIGGSDRKYSTMELFHSFPPTNPELGGDIVPAVGAKILPAEQTRSGRGYELLLGYRFATNTFAVRSGIIIDYTVAGKQYEATLPARMVACPTTMSDEECSKKAHAIFPHG